MGTSYISAEKNICAYQLLHSSERLSPIFFDAQSVCILEDHLSDSIFANFSSSYVAYMSQFLIHVSFLNE